MTKKQTVPLIVQGSGYAFFGAGLLWFFTNSTTFGLIAVAGLFLNLGLRMRDWAENND